MTQRSSVVWCGLFLLALLALGAVLPGAAWAQNGNEPAIPTLDVVGLAGLVAAVGGVGLLGLRARRRGRK